MCDSSVKRLQSALAKREKLLSSTLTRLYGLIRSGILLLRAAVSIA